MSRYQYFPPTTPATIAVDRIEKLLQRAETHQFIGAFTHLAWRSALSEAARADFFEGTDRPILSGLPIAVKDNIDVAGMPTTAGSPALAGHTPARSASAVQRLVDAGAIVLGKTNMHEFALGVTSNNDAYGPVRNPYNHDRIAGGSSGGTAAAIAVGIVPAGLGTDTGGSVRIPAALCGLVGFRPSTGRWPSDGVVPISHTRDTIGPMAHSVAVCAALDAVVCDMSESLESVSLQGLRVGVPRKGFWESLHPEVAAAAELTLLRLTGAGVDLVECDLGIDLAECAETALVIAMAENLAGLRSYWDAHGLPFNATAIAALVASPDVQGVFSHLLSGDMASASDYEHALQVKQAAYRSAYARCFAEHRIDAVIFPTTPLPASRIGEDDTVSLLGETVSTFMTFTRNVGPATVIGTPGISIPMGLTADGLPMGIELDGLEGCDRRLLSLAAAIESALPTLPPPSINS